MKTDIRDDNLLRTLDPRTLAGYLKNRGWTMAGKFKSDVPVFAKDALQVLVPMTKTYADYGLRVGELLAALSEDEKRSKVEVFEDLMFTSADKIRFRLKSPLARRGVLPINLGVTFVERARDVIQAAACSAVEKKPYYHGRRVQKVEDYMARVYLGQTERGSFVLNAGSPVSAPVDQLVDEEPFERMVTKTLLKSVSAAKEAAANATLGLSDSPFYDAHTVGVSANLCSALSEIFVGDEDSVLEIALHWSPLRPSPKTVESSIHLESNLSTIFYEASKALKKRAPRDDFELRGSVIKLHREEAKDDGQIVVYGLVDEEYRGVKVALSGSVYDEAARAHAEKLPVFVEGELCRVGRGYQLKHPRNFGVVEYIDEEILFDFDVDSE